MRDRLGWVRDRVAVFLWSKQREILEAVVGHRYVAVKSAHDTGTGHGASRAVGWWLDTREETRLQRQLPTTKQVHAILWRSSAGLIAGAAFLAASRSVASSNRGPERKELSRLITINRR